MIDELNAWVAGNMASWWLLPLVTGMVLVDGVFPPMPSEAILAAAAAVGAETGRPNLLILGLAAGTGAFLGDNTAYLIGRFTPLARIRHSERARVRRAMGRAEREFASHSGGILITARFVPIGRVAVNMSAGVTAFPWSKFVWFSGSASALWASYMVGIGALAGAWVQDNAVYAALLAVAIALGLGVLVDLVRRRLRRSG